MFGFRIGEFVEMKSYFLNKTNLIKIQNNLWLTELGKYNFKMCI